MALQFRGRCGRSSVRHTPGIIGAPHLCMTALATWRVMTPPSAAQQTYTGPRATAGSVIKAGEKNFPTQKFRIAVAKAGFEALGRIRGRQRSSAVNLTHRIVCKVFV